MTVSTLARAPKYKTGATLLKQAQIKVTATDDDSGIVEQIVSVFGNVDSYGDVVVAGAFDDSLAAWAAKGDPIPVIWAHEWADPFKHIGWVLEGAEVDKGLKTRYQLDLDNPTAAQVYRLLKGRRVTQASFAYDIVDAGWEVYEDADTGKKYEVYELRKLDILEVGPCLIGANRQTELLTAKVAELADAATHELLAPAQLAQLAAARDVLDEITKTSPAAAGEPAPDGQPASTAADPTPAPQPAKGSASGEHRSASSRALSAITTALIESALEETP